MCVNHVACREEGQEVEVKVPITTAHSITTCVCSVACGKVAGCDARCDAQLEFN